MSHTVYALTADHSEGYSEGDDWISLFLTEAEACEAAKARTEKDAEQLVGDEQYTVPPLTSVPEVSVRCEWPDSHPAQCWVTTYLEHEDEDGAASWGGFVIYRVECPGA